MQSPDAKGWQSKRFSAYPQIIIIELVEPTLLRQVLFAFYRTDQLLKPPKQDRHQDRNRNQALVNKRLEKTGVRVIDLKREHELPSKVTQVCQSQWHPGDSCKTDLQDKSRQQSKCFQSGGVDIFIGLWR